ncbi:MAG TPA: DUF402 domain-containing protein [Nocardioides sp.]|jgi:hypothetical protein|nr:DUF402 domain-containing protein [Nocardioides sp.]
MAFVLGDLVRVEMEKWGDRPHWQFDAVWLGSDRHGDWIGFPSGTAMSRPDLAFVSQNDQVGLVPAADLPVEQRAFVATFHAVPHPRVLVYVDITSPPRWDGHVLRTVDLDLDVIRLVGGEVIIDDEDEFAEHQVELGYPPEIIALAESSRDRVHTVVLNEDPPYDGSHQRWLDVLETLSRHT